MFSAKLNDGPPSSATRSRRRQRPLSADKDLPQPKAKRQRLPLTEQTFINPDAKPERVEVGASKTATLDQAMPDGPENAVIGPVKDLSVRPKKLKAADRGAKGDGSTILVSASLDLNGLYGY
jgi:nuclear pore complex protein Nup133